MGLRIGALCLAMPGRVVLAATLGFSFIFPSGTAALEHMGVRMGPIFPDTSAPFEELIFLAMTFSFSLLLGFAGFLLLIVIVALSIRRR